MSRLTLRLTSRLTSRLALGLVSVVVVLGLLVPGGLVLCASQDGHVAVELLGPGGCADDLDCNRLVISHDDCAGPCADVVLSGGTAIGGGTNGDTRVSLPHDVVAVTVPRLSVAVQRALSFAAEMLATTSVVARIVCSTILLN